MICRWLEGENQWLLREWKKNDFLEQRQVVLYPAPTRFYQSSKIRVNPALVWIDYVSSWY